MTTPITQIERLISRAPQSAKTLRVSAKSLGSLQSVIERDRDECDSLEPKELATHLLEAIENWTDSQQKETVFLIQWLSESDRQLEALPIRVSPTNGAALTGLPAIDGSMESLLAGMQAASQAKDKLMIDQLKAMTELYISMVQSLQVRLEYAEGREQENRELKELIVEAQSDTTDNFNERLERMVKVFAPIIQAGMNNKSSG